MTDDESWRTSLAAAYSTTTSALPAASRESVTCIVAAAESAQAKRNNHFSADSFSALSLSGKKQVTIMEPREDDLPSSRRRHRQQQQIPAKLVEHTKNSDSGNEEGDCEQPKKSENVSIWNDPTQPLSITPMASQFSAPQPQPPTTASLLHMVADKLQMISPTNSNISPVHSIDRQSDNDSGCPLEEYAWVPAGLRPDLVHRYFSAFSEHQIPYVNSPGEKLRVRVLLHQLPPHDNDLRYCHHLLDEQQRGEMRRFIAQRKQLALGRATVKLIPRSLAARAPCKQCHGAFKPGALAVFAARDGPYSCWHPQCFCCAQCNELLVDLIYFHNGDQKIYCGRHHAELWKPRCAACDEIIFSDDCTEAEGDTWHPQHFCCSQCDVALGGRRYICRECRPYCVGCYEMLFSRTCAACRQIISVEQLQVSHNNIHWHANESCFRCQQCETSLINRHFLPRNGNVFCSTKCLDASGHGQVPIITPANVDHSETSSNTTPPENAEEQTVTVVRQLEAIQEEDDEIADSNHQQNARRSATPSASRDSERNSAKDSQQQPLVTSTSSRVVPGSASVRRSASQRYVESFQLSSTSSIEPTEDAMPEPFPLPTEVQRKSLETVLRENATNRQQPKANNHTDALIDDLASIYVNIFPDGLQTKIMAPPTQTTTSSSGTCSGSNCSKESTPSQIESKSGSRDSDHGNGRNSCSSSLQRRARTNEQRSRSTPSRDNSSDCTHSCSVHSPCRRRPHPAPVVADDGIHSARPRRRPQRPVAISLSNIDNVFEVNNKEDVHSNAPGNVPNVSQLPNSHSSYSNFDPQQQQQHRSPPPPIPVRHPQTILTPTTDRRALLLMSSSKTDLAVSPYSIGNATPNPSAKFSHPAAPYYTPSALQPRSCCQQSSSDVGIEAYHNHHRQQLQCSSSSSAVSAHRYQPQPSTTLNKFMYGTVGGGGGSTVRINTLTKANNNSWLASAGARPTTSTLAPSNTPSGAKPTHSSPLGVIADDGIYSVGCLGHISSAASRRKRKTNERRTLPLGVSSKSAMMNGNTALARLASNSNSHKPDNRCVIS